MNTDIALSGLAAVPIIAALIQAFKWAVPKTPDDRYLPPLAIVMGVAWNVATEWSDGVSAAVVLVGVVMGLAASGLYSSAKTYTKG